MTKPRAHVDFETFSAADLKKVGPCRYAEDPSTEVLCMGWAIGDEEPSLWLPGQPFPVRLFSHLESGGLLVAWNAEFERAIWGEIQWGWPRVPLRQWRDTAATAASLALPIHLGSCGAALELDVQKDKRGEYLIKKLCKPRKPSKSNPATRWTPETAPEDFRDLYAYCLQDVRSERAIEQALPIPDVPPSELDVWQLTVRMNERGWAVDKPSINRILRLLTLHSVRAQAEIRELTFGEVQTGSQVERIRAWLETRGLSLPSLTEDVVAEALELEDLDPDARRLLELRQELAKTSVKKYAAMRDRACRDGTVKNNVVYHGATTGRDAGRGMQIQNFPRASVVPKKHPDPDACLERAIRALWTEDPLETVELMFGGATRFASAMLRPMLTARDGWVLYGGDYSSIENRITVWYAQDEKGMQIFRDGLDQYRMFAVDFYGVRYEDVTEEQRDHAKGVILGCCFGMGVDTFIRQAKKFGQDASREVAQRAIDGYREIYSDVVQLWYGLNRAAIEAVRTRKPQRYKLIRFAQEGDFLFMILASGRRLAYYKPEVRNVRMPWGDVKPAVTCMGVDAYSKEWRRLQISPGRFTENAVQATARDVMMAGALATERAGYQLVGRVHDELISEALADFGSVKEYQELMCPQLPWLRGIPIEAKCWRGRRFRK